MNDMDAEMQAKAMMSMAKGPTLGSQFMAYAPLPPSLPFAWPGADRYRVTFDALLCGIVVCQCIRWMPNYRHDTLLIRVVMVSTHSSRPARPDASQAFGAVAAIASTFL